MGGDGPSEGFGRGGQDVVFGVIPAGGAGTRLWPRSRRSRPKHTLALAGAETLLRASYQRLQPLVDRVLILTAEEQVAAIKAALPELADDQLVIEPEPRGTAAALGLAARTLLERDPHAVMLSTAADHVIAPDQRFTSALQTAIGAAASGESLVTVGLQPRFAATGYGYIRAGDPLGPKGVYRVERFVEKPERARAEEFLSEGGYYWNLSLFCWRASTFLDELGGHAPELRSGVERTVRAREAGDEASAGAEYRRLPAQAVDYAVLEKSDRLVMVAGDFDWTDVGSWSELHSLLPKDADGNAADSETILIGAQGCLISAPGKLVAAVGVRDLAIVDAGDALLVCSLERSQDVKLVVEQLGRAGKINYL